MRTAIVGGGAAGFFLAVNLKEMCPEMEITIFEKSKKVLAKVEVSGGGRCNCTNSFDAVSDLQQVYPRGHRLLKRLFKTFDYRDAYAWFESRGVKLTTQDDNCVFPASQDSHTIINLFLAEARRKHIEIRTQCKIESLDELERFRFQGHHHRWWHCIDGWRANYRSCSLAVYVQYRRRGPARLDGHGGRRCYRLDPRHQVPQ